MTSPPRVIRIRGARGMPGCLHPNHDYHESLFLSSTIGIFSPMPTLSSHEHRDSEASSREPTRASPDFHSALVREELLKLARTVAFPNVSMA